MKIIRIALTFVLAMLLTPTLTRAQALASLPPPAEAAAAAQETASALGLTPLLDKLRALQSTRACNSPAGPDELALRQQFLESVTATSLDVDGALAEISNERTDLNELRGTLEARRDRTVSLLNTANLITGTGLGIAVNAMQFSTATANLGDGIGVGSGIASTVLAILGIRKQNGPLHGPGDVPNMLAPLFDAKPALNTYYPPEVLRYLNDAPPGDDPAQETRLARLMRQWVDDGRLDAPGSPKRVQKIAVVTSSMSKTTKVSISDLEDRNAMLGDVAGRVALMKRDMAAMMRLLHATEGSCQP